MEQMKDIKHQFELDLIYFQEKIVQEAKSMARDLISIAKNIEEGQLKVINSSGELQGRGVAFDVLCAKLAMTQTAINRFK